MNRAMILLVLVAVGLASLGCKSGDRLTVTETVGEVKRRDAQITNVQLRMLLEDWDYFWLYDRSSRMSPWHTQVGLGH